MHISGLDSVQRMAHLAEQTQILCQQRSALWGKRLPLHIIAISKGQSKEKILPLLESGHRAFGENRMQEAEEKWTPLKKLYPESELHFVGALQSNKIDKAIELFDFIHSLDRPKLAQVLEDKQKEGVRLPKLFIQINVGGEEQKAGLKLEEAEGFIESCLKRGLPIVGLMCLPPADKNPALYFALLKEMADRYHLPELSMGMSSSLEAGILLGATYIRPGTIIFGQRSD